MIARRVAPLLFLLAGACVAAPPANTAEANSSNPVIEPAATPTSSPPIPSPPPPPAILSGEFEQGGFIRGVAPFGTVSATLDGEPFDFDPEDRHFFVGLDRDAGRTVELVFTARDGQTRVHRIEVAPRDWQIQRVDVALRPRANEEEWWKEREPEWIAIRDARVRQTGAEGWKQNFVWPVTGRISGRFGRQRIYRGEPGSYHSGIDIAPGNGVPFVAPADGVVVLARTGFSLEGGIIIVDHGAGLNSAFIHLSRLAVSEGDVVRQGQALGNIGASGRATGPHLHWSVMWGEARLDPLLLTGPMP